MPKSPKTSISLTTKIFEKFFTSIQNSSELDKSTYEDIIQCFESEEATEENIKLIIQRKKNENS